MFLKSVVTVIIHSIHVFGMQYATADQLINSQNYIIIDST